MDGPNWQIVEEDGEIIGHECSQEDGLFFFGNRFGSLERIQSHYHQYGFSFLNQVHGDHPVEVTEPPKQIFSADAQYTTVKKLALLIKTADCLPILALSKPIALAIHAGWRGVENKIIQKAILKSGLPSHANFKIGPHIQKDSFEVEEKIAAQILSACSIDLSSATNDQIIKKDPVIPTKVYLDLGELAYRQIQSINSNFHIEISTRDTYSNSDLISYRRNRGTAERLWSFVVRL